MQALVYLGLNQKSLEDRPKPIITDPTDAIVKVTRTTICGTDLHILKGDVPTCTPGRIPHADMSLYAIPAGVDEDALVMLSDILPTALECGVLNGRVQPGSTVAIVGSGPIGLAALLTACMASRSNCIGKVCGIATSASPPGWRTRSVRPCCSRRCVHTRWTRSR